MTLLAALCLAGCAIHPLPEDVTLYSTEAIVVHVRCEMRAALRDVLIEFLSLDEHADEVPVQRLVDKLKRHPEAQIVEDDVDHFETRTQTLIDKYRRTGIAYNFTFNMAENAGGAATLNFLKAFTGAAGTLGVTASDSRSRQNIRTFTITDTPGTLLLKLDPPGAAPQNRYCANYSPAIDYRYPVTGNVGLKEIVDTFVHLSLFDSLGDKDGTTKGPPTLADKLSFTTTIGGSLTPKIALSPVRHGLVDANLSASAGRTDIHELVVALSLPLSDKEAKAAGKKPGSTVHEGSLISAQGSEAELSAARAVSQLILRFDLRGSTIIVNGDAALPF